MVTVTNSRRIALLDDVTRLINDRRLLYKEFESTIGKLPFIAGVCRGGRAYMHNDYATSSTSAYVRHRST